MPPQVSQYRTEGLPKCEHTGNKLTYNTQLFFFEAFILPSVVLKIKLLLISLHPYLFTEP